MKLLNAKREKGKAATAGDNGKDIPIMPSNTNCDTAAATIPSLLLIHHITNKVK